MDYDFLGYLFKRKGYKLLVLGYLYIYKYFWKSKISLKSFRQTLTIHFKYAYFT